jgi:DNA-directed RNA polymerase subunit RPC12/RpoP
MTDPAVRAHARQQAAGVARCTTCQGRVWSVRHGKWVARRETVGLVCQTCGRDYRSPSPAGTDTTRDDEK